MKTSRHKLPPRVVALNQELPDTKSPLNTYPGYEYFITQLAPQHSMNRDQ